MDILTILRKETLDTLRDRRSLMVMIIMPMVVFPLIFTVVAMVTKSTSENEMTRSLKIGFVAESDDLGLKQLLDEPNVLKLELVEMEDSSSFRSLIPDSLDGGVYLGANFSDRVNGRNTGEIIMFFDQTEQGVKSRLKTVLQMFQQQRDSQRLSELSLTQANIEPVHIEEVGVASREEVMGKLAGGFLPYIIIVFSFLGCMYTSIDMFAGEKERGSFETILTVPIDRWKILVGKMGVIVLMGMLTTSLGFLGLYIGLGLSDALPEQIIQVVNDILSPGFILSLMGMMLLLTIFFAGLMTPISLYARNFKEAQSTIAPLQVVAIIPALIGAFPGVELSNVTALIPVLNIVLSTKEIIAGTIDPFQMVLVIASLLLLAVISVYISFRRFGNEQNVLRS